MSPDTIATDASTESGAEHGWEGPTAEGHEEERQVTQGEAQGEAREEGRQVAGHSDLDLIRSANDDPEFAMAAHAWNAQLRLGRVGIVIEGGRITGVSMADGPSTIRIAGPDEGWQHLLSASPQPFYQDLWGAMTHHGFAVEGDFENFCQYYAAVRRLIELMRA